MSIILIRDRIAAQPNNTNDWVIIPMDQPIDKNRPWITFSPGINANKLQAVLATLSIKVTDGEMCPDCGITMTRTGACYTCPQCGKAGGCG